MKPSMLPSKTSNIDLRMSFSEAPDVILCIMEMNSWKFSEPSLSASNSVIISATASAVIGTPHFSITDLSSAASTEPDLSSSYWSN
jgi:hypothetical protein